MNPPARVEVVLECEGTLDWVPLSLADLPDVAAQRHLDLCQEIRRTYPGNVSADVIVAVAWQLHIGLMN